MVDKYEHTEALKKTTMKKPLVCVVSKLLVGTVSHHLQLGDPLHLLIHLWLVLCG